jgi:hypothetical protein
VSEIQDLLKGQVALNASWANNAHNNEMEAQRLIAEKRAQAEAERREKAAQEAANKAAAASNSLGSSNVGGNTDGLNFYGPVDRNQLTTINTAAGRVTVNKAAAASFQGFLNELVKRGYKVNSLGGYNVRKIAGTDRWSSHSGGWSVDINPGRNPVSYGKVKTDMPPWVNSLAQKYNIYWGGAWKGNKKDAMHFSYGKAM